MEIWKKVDSADGLYEVSSEGRLRQCVGYKRRTGRMLNPPARASGYVQATVRLKDGSARHPLLHRLVAAAFIGPIPDGMQVNHKNGKKNDNRVVNLEIVTAAENNLHAFRVLNRTRSPGSKHHSAKLTEVDVLDIRWLHGLGVKQFELAKEYGIDKTTVRDLVHRHHWNHI